MMGLHCDNCDNRENEYYRHVYYDDSLVYWTYLYKHLLANIQANLVHIVDKLAEISIYPFSIPSIHGKQHVIAYQTW